MYKTFSSRLPQTSSLAQQQDEEEARSLLARRRESEDSSVTIMQEPRDHAESHSRHGDQISNAIIGFADGLTVPFALTAGLTAYVFTHVWISRVDFFTLWLTIFGAELGRSTSSL